MSKNCPFCEGELEPCELSSDAYCRDCDTTVPFDVVKNL